MILLFCRDSQNVQREKKYKLDAEDCDRWDSVESVVKNEESKDIEGFQFLLSCLD